MFFLLVDDIKIPYSANCEENLKITMLIKKSDISHLIKSLFVEEQEYLNASDRGA